MSETERSSGVTTIEYTIRFSGDMWDHEQFRKEVNRQWGEIEGEKEV